MIIKIQLLQGMAMHMTEIQVYVPDDIGVETFQKATKLVQDASRSPQSKSPKPPKKPKK